MSNSLATLPGRQAGRRPAGLVSRAVAAVSCVAIVLVSCLPVTAAGAEAEAVHTYQLLPGLVAKVQADGGLLFSTGAQTRPLLSGGLAAGGEARRRRSQERPPFAAVVAEGAPGGLRGFSAQRDDDQDGLVDEDPLDGVDNDGDGLLDEDYAAISEAMVVVEAESEAAGRIRVEHFHWSYPRLRSSLMLSVRSEWSLAGADGYRLELAGAAWRDAAPTAIAHSLTGQPRTARTAAFVAWVPQSAAAGLTPCDPLSGYWVGVVVPAAPDAAGDARPVLDAGRLTIPVGPEARPLALCVAESWLQLADRLQAAELAYRGVSDQVTGQHEPWIVPPGCVHCRRAQVPAFTWEVLANGDLAVTARLTAESRGALDPDLFRSAGLPLGSPREIRWLPESGQGVAVAWSCRHNAAAERGVPGHPYETLAAVGDHQSAGRLQFIFAGPERRERPVWEPGALATGPLTGVSLDGRSFSGEAKRVGSDRDRTSASALAGNDPLVGTAAAQDQRLAPNVPAPNDQARLLKSAGRPPTLALELLEGHPNPFRDTVQLRYTVPATMAEAFVWEKDNDPPAGFEPQAAVPWRGGAPQVSVKIYSLNGQELVTLFTGEIGPGSGTLQWNGTDSNGRQVASGTYFCKLQLDEWSVTRRLVFLR